MRSICFCTGLQPTDMRRFHVYQCPQSLQSWSADACHWYTEELVFALLEQFVWYQTGTTLPQDLRRDVQVHDTQVFHHTNLKQSTVANEQHCGQCLLHASCGNLWEHSCLDCLLKSGDTISILTVPPDTHFGSTFGVIILGHPRVVRRFEFRPQQDFYGALRVRMKGGGRVQEVVKSLDWKTSGHWEGVSRLPVYFRPRGDANVKRSGGQDGMQSDGWISCAVEKLGTSRHVSCSTAYWRAAIFSCCGVSVGTLVL